MPEPGASTENALPERERGPVRLLAASVLVWLSSSVCGQAVAGPADDVMPLLTYTSTYKGANGTGTPRDVLGFVSWWSGGPQTLMDDSQTQWYPTLKTPQAWPPTQNPLIPNALTVATIAAFSIPTAGPLIASGVTAVELAFKAFAPQGTSSFDPFTQLETQLANDVAGILTQATIDGLVQPSKAATAFLQPYFSEAWGVAQIPASFQKSEILTPLCGSADCSTMDNSAYIQSVFNTVSALAPSGSMAATPPTNYAAPPPFSVYAGSAWAYTVSTYLWLNKVAAVITAYPDDCTVSSGQTTCVTDYSTMTTADLMKASYARNPAPIDNIILRLPGFIQDAQTLMATVQSGIAQRLLMIGDVTQYQGNQYFGEVCFREYIGHGIFSTHCSLPVGYAMIDSGLTADTRLTRLSPSSAKACASAQPLMSSSSIAIKGDQFVTASPCSDAGTQAIILANARAWLVYKAQDYATLWRYADVMGLPASSGAAPAVSALVSTWQAMLQTYCGYLPDPTTRQPCIGLQSAGAR